MGDFKPCGFMGLVFNTWHQQQYWGKNETVLPTSLRNRCEFWRLTTAIPHSTKNEYYIKLFIA
jgi:hypothetical protein